MSQFMFKQDLAMAYFPDRSKESAGKLLAREIHTNEPLMSELSKTAYSPNANSSPQNKSKSSTPSSANPESPPPKTPKSTTLNTTKGETSSLAYDCCSAEIKALFTEWNEYYSCELRLKQSNGVSTHEYTPQSR